MGLISPQVPEFPQKQFDILHPIGSILAPVVYACLFHNTAYDHEGIFCEIKKKIILKILLMTIICNSYPRNKV